MCGLLAAIRIAPFLGRCMRSLDLVQIRLFKLKDAEHSEGVHMLSICILDAFLAVCCSARTFSTWRGPAPLQPLAARATSRVQRGDSALAATLCSICHVTAAAPCAEGPSASHWHLIGIRSVSHRHPLQSCAALWGACAVGGCLDPTACVQCGCSASSTAGCPAAVGGAVRWGGQQLQAVVTAAGGQGCGQVPGVQLTTLSEGGFALPC